MIHTIAFLSSEVDNMILSMASGILMLLVIPAIISFVFGIWVFYSVVIDVSKRETSQFTVVGPDTIRMKIDPAE
ncbi:MAG: hypothetical protein M3136_11885 [Thermoproteota archaeon]|jgi:hypothetical protein|nr:hypothetical protein [Thermoproteota archaeon]